MPSSTIVTLSSAISFLKIPGLLLVSLCFLLTPTFAQLPRLYGDNSHSLMPGPESSRVRSSSGNPGVADEASRDRFIALQLVDDFRYLVSQPDFYLLVGGVSLAPSVFPKAFRLESPEFTELWGSSQFADNMFEAGEIIGQGSYPIAASAAFWSLGRVGGQESLRDFGSDLFRAQALNGLFTVALKGATKRTRPDGAPYSYPSGHTSSAFATAGVVYRHLGARWGLPAFVLATYVGFSRLQENKHYFSDIVAGGILGSYIGLKIGGRRRSARKLRDFAGNQQQHPWRETHGAFLMSWVLPVEDYFRSSV